MVDITLKVVRSEDGRDLQELTTISLPGVPRVGESVIADNTIWEVRKVTWGAEFVSLHVYSESYHIGFPTPPDRDCGVLSHEACGIPSIHSLDVYTFPNLRCQAKSSALANTSL